LFLCYPISLGHLAPYDLTTTLSLGFCQESEHVLVVLELWHLT